MEPILRTENLTIRFGGHIAVDHVNFTMPEKHLKSIIGPNGAGKTTFFNLISGELKPTVGDVYFKGQSLAQASSVERTRMGLGRSFQITNVFPNLTVLENVRLAVQSKEKIRYQMFRHFKSYQAITEKAEELLTLVLLHNKRDALTTMLSHGEKRKLEIAMLLALDTEILLLDEPTAGMSLEEVPAILEVIRTIKHKGDKTILLIEHKMDMILDLSDSIMVLFNGQLLADGTPDAIMQNETVQNAYLGGLYDEHLTEIT
ncbi:ABC transporter ATP-binding protein [Lysinibacillus sphaericus]|uniref:ABC transporter ATP-binding protein n=1 Tax=Lysinibacillus sphaericus TaxID=1421 RepID=A0A2S0K1B1_LYSSH|nr:ABC transporter ATP-binding protein [Lysinibacillus sphaericus]AVK97044.1 ABC transporter ATP-binding protein [Lysinibacillus sphaericus]MCS1384679.1 ABC transporter ATP-binding protein [Lysinibacillus sphaericus]MED4542323.1 ABC transporter ATP-binding protein [Lysinibacillus sphaericus]TKI20320.1 ABC transporter ATP-binding protein [Lysinibacillus sphaericus]SUV17102.1 branched-chain amino acid ABC transporter ATP-binding protein [Lysinibacillus sphaericus]